MSKREWFLQNILTRKWCQPYRLFRDFKFKVPKSINEQLGPEALYHLPKVFSGKNHLFISTNIYWITIPLLVLKVFGNKEIQDTVPVPSAPPRGIHSPQSWLPSEQTYRVTASRQRKPQGEAQNSDSKKSSFWMGPVLVLEKCRGASQERKRSGDKGLAP